MSQLSTEYQIREEMFATLYEDNQKPIERYLVKWVHDQESARDLCQETFKQLWEYLCKDTVVKQYTYYKNWLYKTAKYRAIDYLRKYKSIVYLSQSEGEADELWTDELENQIDIICKQDDLLQLPQHQRDSLVQYALGYKQKEIAKTKGISESAVSAYISLGRTNLRKKSFIVTADLKPADDILKTAFLSEWCESGILRDEVRLKLYQIRFEHNASATIQEYLLSKGMPLNLLVERAQSTLARLSERGSRFEELARSANQFINVPSRKNLSSLDAFVEDMKASGEVS